MLWVTAILRPRQDSNRKGFTLVEMLIVIIVLGILAMIIVPQISVSTEDAKVSTLQTNLSALRSAMELYYAQHDQKYPGDQLADGTGPTTSDALAVTAFTAQLTLFSEADGTTSADKTTLTAPVFGPYLKDGLPDNPFSSSNSVAADFDEATLTRAASAPATAWKIYPKTGILIANDGGASNGVNHDTY